MAVFAMIEVGRYREEVRLGQAVAHPADEFIDTTCMLNDNDGGKRAGAVGHAHVAAHGVAVDAYGIPSGWHEVSSFVPRR
jgi:hypothetical protein